MYSLYSLRYRKVDILVEVSGLYEEVVTMQSLSKRILGAIGILYLLIMICINLLIIITSSNIYYGNSSYIYMCIFSAGDA